jgi:hypothetical protein
MRTDLCYIHPLYYVHILTSEQQEGAMTKKKKSNNSSNSPFKKGSKKTGVSDDGASLLTEVEHDDLRTGIQSIMTQMDDMLSGMKQYKKPK